MTQQQFENLKVGDKVQQIINSEYTEYMAYSFGGIGQDSIVEISKINGKKGLTFVGIEFKNITYKGFMFGCNELRLIGVINE